MHQERVLIEPVKGKRAILLVVLDAEVLGDPDRVQVDLLVNVALNHFFILLAIRLGT